MLHSAPGAQMAQRKAALSAAPHVRLFCRPVVLRRFREDDKAADLLMRRERVETVRQEQEKWLEEQQLEQPQEKQPVSRENNTVQQVTQQQPQSSPASLKLKSSIARPPQQVVDAGVEVGLFTPAFTRQREIFAGRLGMVGYFMACLWEYYYPSHPNILQQVSGLTQGLVSPSVALFLVSGLVVYNTVAALGPWSPTFSRENLQDVAKRPAGPPINNVDLLDYKKFFGVTNWGFTKANELFNGRLSMLGFGAALIQQVKLGGVGGPGPLAQLANFLGLRADDAFYGSMGGYFVGFMVFAVVLAWVRGNSGFSTTTEDDIY